MNDRDVGEMHNVDFPNRLNVKWALYYTLMVIKCFTRFSETQWCLYISSTNFNRFNIYIRETVIKCERRLGGWRRTRVRELKSIRGIINGFWFQTEKVERK